MIWHSEHLNDIIAELKTDTEKGLSNGVAEERLQRYGSNSLSFGKSSSFASIFFAQLNNFAIIALLAVALLSLIVTLISDDKQWFSPILIFTIVIINAVVTAFEEIKAEDTADILKDFSAPTATVIRDGLKKIVDSSELVPGDIIFLRKGDYISADARLIQSSALCCDESAITGSHVPVDKNQDFIPESITPISERENMVFAGCSVTHGSGVAIVVATGCDSEIGKERSILEQTGSRLIPVKESVTHFSRLFSIISLVVCILVFIIGMLYNFKNANISRTLIDAFLNSMALAVAVIPEGLPTAVAVILTLGVQRLVTKNVIVKDISSVETMGGVSIICADKTGTLTENDMTVTKVFNGREILDISEHSGDDIKMILRLATICNNASEFDGDPTGKGIAEACRNICGMSKQDTENLYPRLGEVPFDSTRKLMTTINMINGKPFAIVKGAPESLLPLCLGKIVDKFDGIINSMAEDALRVLAVAVKPLDEIPANPSADELECNLNFVGLLGLADSPRPETVRAVLECKKAGIRTVMLTGDHPTTAGAMARRLGILTDDTEIITDVELAAMNDEELLENIEKYSVYARISNTDRLRIVKAWKEKGHCVAVTGDSVDDTAALMAADVGCAMGKSGTDVAKGVSDIILTDDDFSSIVNSVKEGRAIFANIRKVLNYLISCNLAELLLMLIGVLVFGRIPLEASQLLWINLITDLIPVIALGMEPPEKTVMHTMPQKKQTLFSKKLLISVAYQSIIICVLSIIAYTIGATINTAVASTMTFATLILSQVFFSLTSRTEDTPALFSLSANKYSYAAVIVSVLLLLFVAVTPIKAMFTLSSLSFGQWLITFALALVPFVVSECIKLIRYMRPKAY